MTEFSNSRRAVGESWSNPASYGAKFFILFLLAAQSLVSGLIVLALAAFLILVLITTSRGIIKKDFFALIAPFALLMVTGVIFASQNTLYEVLKDVFYVGKVIIALGVGFLLAKYIDDVRSILRVVVIAAVLSSLVHLSELIINLKGGVSIYQLRNDEGIRGHFISIIGLALLITHWRKKIYVSGGYIYYIFSLTICGLSVVASFSRTYLVLLLLTVITLSGAWKISISNLFRFIAMGMFLTLLVLVGGDDEVTGGRSLTDKFMHSSSEVAPQDYENMKDINLNWRGFESYRALVDYQEGGYFQKFFGQGLGATVDLGFYMKLGGGEMRFIPLLHNGYMYILVKFGIVGIFAYSYFLFTLIKLGIRAKAGAMSSEWLTLHRLVAALGVGFFLSTFVVAGAFNGSMFALLVLTGLLFAKCARKWSVP